MWGKIQTLHLAVHVCICVRELLSLSLPPIYICTGYWALKGLSKSGNHEGELYRLGDGKE